MIKLTPDEIARIMATVERVTGRPAEDRKDLQKKVPASKLAPSVLDNGTWLARIVAAGHDCHVAHETAKKDGESWRLRAAVDAAYQRERELIQDAAQAFGRLNGWSVSRRFFLPGMAGGWATAYGHNQGWIDHPINYIRDRRPVAFVSQPYLGHGLDGLGSVLDRGFVLHTPANPLASLWNPGVTMFLVLTQPDVEVQWLPEQADPEWRRGFGGVQTEEEWVVDAREQIAELHRSRVVVSFAEARGRRQG